jgi:hypothetical protein
MSGSDYHNEKLTLQAHIKGEFIILEEREREKGSNILQLRTEYDKKY